jgi:hypothetical protein
MSLPVVIHSLVWRTCALQQRHENTLAVSGNTERVYLAPMGPLMRATGGVERTLYGPLFCAP